MEVLLLEVVHLAKSLNEISDSDLTGRDMFGRMSRYVIIWPKKAISMRTVIM